MQGTRKLYSQYPALAIKLKVQIVHTVMNVLMCLCKCVVTHLSAYPMPASALFVFANRNIVTEFKTSRIVCTVSLLRRHVPPAVALFVFAITSLPYPLSRSLSAIVQGEQLWPTGRTNQTSELLSWRSVMLNCLKRLRRPESLLLQHSLQKQHDVFHRHKDTFNQIWPKKVLFFGWGCLCFCEKIHVFGENVAVALWSP